MEFSAAISAKHTPKQKNKASNWAKVRAYKDYRSHGKNSHAFPWVKLDLRRVQMGRNRDQDPSIRDTCLVCQFKNNYFHLHV